MFHSYCNIQIFLPPRNFTAELVLNIKERSDATGEHNIRAM